MICKYSVKKYSICLVLLFFFMHEWAAMGFQAVEKGTQEWSHSEQLSGLHGLQGAAFGITLSIPLILFEVLKNYLHQ